MGNICCILYSRLIRVWTRRQPRFRFCCVRSTWSCITSVICSMWCSIYCAHQNCNTQQLNLQGCYFVSKQFLINHSAVETKSGGKIFVKSYFQNHYFQFKRAWFCLFYFYEKNKLILLKRTLTSIIFPARAVSYHIFVYTQTVGSVEGAL